MPDILDGLSHRDTPGHTKHEVGEALRRIANHKCLEPVSEYPVHLDGEHNSRRVDWVWLKRGCPVAAFEIEGSNAPDDSITVGVQKLKKLGIKASFFVLYTKRYKVGPKEPWMILPYRDEILKRAQAASIEVVRDTELNSLRQLVFE